ncbi:hypothetical protein D3C75_550750 [compost metagenome]
MVDALDKAVEGGRQLADFISRLHLQATGQVAFAEGDVFHDPGQHLQRPGDALRGVPDQQQAEQGRTATEQQLQRGALHALGIEFVLQRGDRCQQHVLRHTDQHAPWRGSGNRRQRFKHLDLPGVDKHFWLALTQAVHHFGIVHRLTEATDVLAVGRNHPTGADDADLAVAIEQFTGAGFAVVLQGGEVDIQSHHGNDLAVFQQREGNAGHQFAAAGGLVEIRFQHTGLAGVAGTGVEGVVRCAARPGLGVGKQAFVTDDRLQLAGFALHPIERKATGFVAAQGGLAGEVCVGTVESTGFENDIKPEQVGLVDQGLVKLGAEFLAQLRASQAALMLQLSQVQQVAR